MGNVPKIEGMKVFVKGGVGPKDKNGRREVLLKINKGGLYANGTQRWSLAIRFTDESYKKVTTSEYVGVGYIEETSRLVFWTESRESGYKLSCSSKGGKFKSITIPCDDVDFWSGREGTYDLLKDVKSNAYYIDLSNR